jgi:capsid protein
VSSRLGQIEEQEHYKSIQQFLIEEVKTLMHEEEVWRLLINRNILLPISKYDKFKGVEFAGRRWKFVQPVDDMRARELQMNNLITSVSDVIAETSQEDTETVFKRIAKDNELMKKYGLVRIATASSAAVSTDADAESNQEPEPPVVIPGGKKKENLVD